MLHNTTECSFLNSEAGFQYTDAGKLSPGHVLSEMKLRQVATGFRGLGQRGSCRKMPKGVKPIVYIDGVAAEKNGSQKPESTDSGSAGSRVEEESFLII